MGLILPVFSAVTFLVGPATISGSQEPNLEFRWEEQGSKFSSLAIVSGPEKFLAQGVVHSDGNLGADFAELMSH